MNAGGVIQVADELHGFSFERAKAKAGDDLRHHRRGCCDRRPSEGVPPAVAADRLAERRMAAGGCRAVGPSTVAGTVRVRACRNSLRAMYRWAHGRRH